MKSIKMKTITKKTITGVNELGLIGEITQSKKLFDVIGHEVRVSIMMFIYTHGEVYISEVNREFNYIEKANISRHLKMLNDVGVLEYRKQGRCVYCTINKDMIGKIFATTDILFGV